MNHLDIVSRLCAHKYATYIVGGAVRDMFCGLDADDIDIVTEATPVQIEHLFRDKYVKTVGKSFGVVLVEGYEVATFRNDCHSVMFDARNCQVSFAQSIHDDVARRDLTINALALCEVSGEIVDDFNGLEDLRNKVIRLVGDPQTRIDEDPVRIIRAARFLAKLEGTFDDDTFEALKNSAYYVKEHIAPERVRAEILKAMTLDTPSLFFGALYIIGALEYILPELIEAVDHDHGKWHKENVWEHMMATGDYVSKSFPLVRLSAFLHDIGKPAAFKKSNGCNFAGHEKIGAKIVEQRLTELKFSKDEVKTVSNLVRAHMWGGAGVEMTDKAIRKMRKRFVDNSIDSRDWLRVRIADRASNMSKEKFNLTDIRVRARIAGVGKDLEEEQPLTVKSLAVSGGELIDYLKLEPGPIIGHIHNRLLDYVVEYGPQTNDKSFLFALATLYKITYEEEQNAQN